jgi:bacteriocin biosynthesis cyclodehydratase domain-containing protein
MTKIYYKPVLRSRPTYDWQSAIPEDLRSSAGSILETLSSLFNGQHQIEYIWGKLLIAHNEPELISQVIEILDKNGFIEESDESGAGLLSDAERVKYASQMKALIQMHQFRDIDSMSLWERSGLSLQINLKKSRLLIVHSKFAGINLVRSLATLGFGNILSVTDSEVEEIDILKLGEEIDRTNNFVQFNHKSNCEDIETVIRQEHPDMIIYCPDTFNEEFCLRLNAISLSENISLLPYKQMGFSVELGPLVIPRDTACYMCYHLRRRADQMPWETTELTSRQIEPKLAIPIGLDFLSVELIRFITGTGEPVTKGKMQQLNFLDHSSTLHPVYKLPRCPACGVHLIRPTRKLWEEI